MSRDQKVMMLLPPTEKSPISIKELFLLPKFDNSSSSVLEIKRFVKVMWLWGNGMVPLPPEAEYPMEPFEWGSPTVQISKLLILLTLSSSKLLVILLTLGKSKLILIVYIY